MPGGQIMMKLQKLMKPLAVGDTVSYIGCQRADCRCLAYTQLAHLLLRWPHKKCCTNRIVKRWGGKKWIEACVRCCGSYSVSRKKDQNVFL